MNIARSVEIQLRDGQVATIDLSDVLLDRIKSTLGLSTHDSVSDDHVKYYLITSMKNVLRSSDVE